MFVSGLAWPVVPRNRIVWIICIIICISPVYLMQFGMINVFFQCAPGISSSTPTLTLRCVARLSGLCSSLPQNITSAETPGVELTDSCRCRAKIPWIFSLWVQALHSLHMEHWHEMQKEQTATCDYIPSLWPLHSHWWSAWAFGCDVALYFFFARLMCIYLVAFLKFVIYPLIGIFERRYTVYILQGPSCFGIYIWFRGVDYHFGPIFVKTLS